MRRRRNFCAPATGPVYDVLGVHEAGPALRGLDPLPLAGLSRQSPGVVDPVPSQHSGARRHPGRIRERQRHVDLARSTHRNRSPPPRIFSPKTFRAVHPTGTPSAARTLFAMILQIATGIFLCFYYAPSTTTAWESTKLHHREGPGRALRALAPINWGASAMIALMADASAASTAVGRLQGKPRELQWIVGVLLFVVTLVLAWTGYLLPGGISMRCSHRRSRDPHRRQRAGPRPAVLHLLQGGDGITNADDQPLLRHPRLA